MKYYESYIRTLAPNEVFVFGSNPQGFHGAGAAGFASFGKSGNVWRNEGYELHPVGWLGRWNVKGQGEGFQRGREGASYALPTVSRAGQKRSLKPAEISAGIKRLYEFARQHPEMEFLVAQDAEVGLNGYSPGEMAKMFRCEEIPANISFYKPFYDYLTL